MNAKLDSERISDITGNGNVYGRYENNHLLVMYSERCLHLANTFIQCRFVCRYTWVRRNEAENTQKSLTDHLVVDGRIRVWVTDAFVNKRSYVLRVCRNKIRDSVGE